MINLGIRYNIATMTGAILNTLFLFFLYSFIGWTLDSGYRSIKHRTWVHGGMWKLPLTPIYGFGAFILLGIAPYITPLPFAVQWIFLGSFFATYEYLSGCIVVRVLKRRLWDYSDGFLNAGGHTDLVHGIYWATLSTFFLYHLHPWVVATAGLESLPF
jgi:uncharacterized membrane protein